MQNEIALNFPYPFNFDAKDLIKKLLKFDKKSRLMDVTEIKNHQFFANMNWEALKNKNNKII